MTTSAASSYAIVVHDNISTWIFGPCTQATGRWRVWYYQVAPGEGYRLVQHVHESACFPNTYFAEAWSARYTVIHQQIGPSASLQQAMADILIDILTEESM